MNFPQFITSIVPETLDCKSRAAELAEQLQLTLASSINESPQLVVTPQKLEIRAANLGNPIFVDFTSGKHAHRRKFGGGKGQPLAKAIGIKKAPLPTVIDATAGLGRDAFVVATLGCTVTLLEKNAVLASLLEDGLQRAKADEETQDIALRMSLIHTDAIDHLQQLTDTNRPDVIYMDPMYPARDKSALVKKDMRLLHQMVGADTDSEQLLVAARQAANKRVVVKRPKGADYVGNIKPATSIASKNTRYDIYLPVC